MALLGSGVLVSFNDLRGEHHVISINPLVVESDLTSVTSRYTPLEDFYVRDHLGVPAPVEMASLAIEGEVEKPQTLTLNSLTALPRIRAGAVLECAGNPVQPNGLISNGLWEGWSLSSVLSLAKPNSSGMYVHLFGRDGYSRSVPIERAHRDGILATHLNGEPLRRGHGAPWRAVFPGSYGVDSIKWLERIAVATAPLPPRDDTYLEVRKDGANGINRQELPRIQLKSVITHPRNRSVVPHGALQVRGLAWSGEARISRVEVSGDGGERWRDATLSAAGLYEWVLWRATVQLPQAGVVDLVCRTTDSRGQIQPELRDASRLDGYVNNSYHRVQVVIE